MFKLLGLLSIFLSFSVEAEKPKWLNSPSDYCGQAKLCAVGESSGRMMAESEARNAIAKIFETKINSTSIVTTTAESKTVDDVVSGEVNEDYQSQINEITEQTLEGVEVKDFYEDSESFYALAVLDKRKAANRLKNKMNNLDDDIASFYEQGKRASLNKALKLFKVRDGINDRYNFLTERNHPARISKRKILRSKNAKRSQGVTVFLKVDELSESHELKNLIIEEFLNNDLRVVTVPTLDHQFAVNVSFTGEKQHMNVKGFEKYKFLLNFTSKNNSGQKIGSLNMDHVTTGRNLNQAYSNALVKVKTYISENLGELNID